MAEPRCGSVSKGEKCWKELDHGGTMHHGDTHSWSMHLPVESEDVRLAEIDRNARAYGWEVGRGHLMVDRMEDCDPANPFLDPNWREHVQVRDE